MQLPLFFIQNLYCIAKRIYVGFSKTVAGCKLLNRKIKVGKSFPMAQMLSTIIDKPVIRS